eukprot:8076228-Heterocapsa_arctica.AAC.1
MMWFPGVDSQEVLSNTFVLHDASEHTEHGTDLDDRHACSVREEERVYAAAELEVVIFRCGAETFPVHDEVAQRFVSMSSPAGERLDVN